MQNLKKYITLIALGLSGGVMYVYPYIRYVFHNPLNEALQINDTQAGLLLTVYGIVSLLLYLPGGMLADKLKAKKPLILSMFWCLVLLVGFALVLSLKLQGNTPYIIALMVWALMPIATTFVFWSSLVKAISLAGGAKDQGRCFGIYFAANAVFGTIISSTNMFMFTKFTDEFDNGLLGVTISVAFFVLVAILAIALFLNEKNIAIPKSESSFKMADVALVLKNGTVWIAAICMMLIYMMFTLTTYFTPYMTVVCGLTNEMSGALTIFRTYFIMIFAAIFSGLIADKIFHSTLKWFKLANILLAISTILFIVFGFSQIRDIFGIPNSIVVIALISIIPGIFSTMIYAIQWAVLSELKLPAKVAGTAAGLASMFVFSPDIWFNTSLGAILDSTAESGQTELGYLIIFLILIFVSILISILCSILIRRNNKFKKEGLNDK